MGLIDLLSRCELHLARTCYAISRLTLHNARSFFSVFLRRQSHIVPYAGDWRFTDISKCKIPLSQRELREQ